MIPSLSPDDLPVPDALRELCRAVREAGGRAWIVGGFVRDLLRGHPGKDLDVEVFGLPLPRLEEILARHGEVLRVGRAFGVLRVKGLDVDFSLPRRDSRVGPGHRGFDVETDPGMSTAEAVRRRDLTVNAILLDPLTGDLEDPAGGTGDLEAGVLRAVDPRTFPEDPLRPLRVAQLSARLEFVPDRDLLELCRGTPLSELPAERIWEEWKKMVLRGRRPSAGLAFLEAAGLLDHWPELAALRGVPQDPRWHPEGDVWEHTLLAMDAAADLRTGMPEDDLQILLAVLCHDLGKATTTDFVGGRWHSYRHEVEGVPLSAALLASLGAPAAPATAVSALVRHHLAPSRLHWGGAHDRTYRRLARALEAGGTRIPILERVARADHLGRTEPGAVPEPFPEGEALLERARTLAIQDRAAGNVVLGRHLIARGMSPGPAFGPLLAECRDVQDETGWDDPDRILDEALARVRGRERPER